MNIKIKICYHSKQCRKFIEPQCEKKQNVLYTCVTSNKEKTCLIMPHFSCCILNFILPVRSCLHGPEHTTKYLIKEHEYLTQYK